jgi:hypothetical protein
VGRGMTKHRGDVDVVQAKHCRHAPLCLLCVDKPYHVILPSVALGLRETRRRNLQAFAGFLSAGVAHALSTSKDSHGKGGETNSLHKTNPGTPWQCDAHVGPKRPRCCKVQACMHVTTGGSCGKLMAEKEGAPCFLTPRMPK